MADWFNFFLYAIQKLVTTVFSLDLGIGFSLGDFEVALLLIGLVATALIVKTGSSLSGEISNAKSITEKRQARAARQRAKYDHTDYFMGF